MMSYVLLLVGFVLLIKGADYFVEGSSSVAKLLKVPSVIIGLTIVAMGTSAPEAAVSITAGLNGSNAIALGNVIGSNIFNLLFILGTTVVISPISVNTDMMIDTVILLIATAMMMFFSFTGKRCGRVEGAITFTCYLGYTAYIICRAYGMI